MFMCCYICYCSSYNADVGEGAARSRHHNRCDTCQRPHFRGRHSSCRRPRRSCSHSSTRIAHATAIERTQGQGEPIVLNESHSLVYLYYWWSWKCLLTTFANTLGAIKMYNFILSDNFRV